MDGLPVLRRPAPQRLRLFRLWIDPGGAIALDVGYKDLPFFRKLFRRRTTLSPTAYRKRFGG